MHGVISGVSIVITPITGLITLLITTYEPPSRIVGASRVSLRHEMFIQRALGERLDRLPIGSIAVPFWDYRVGF